jgi:hypothetical protein
MMCKTLCRRLRIIFVAALMFCAMETAARADIKLKIRNTENERSGESVVQIKGRRQRNDFFVKRPDGTPHSVAVIFQCDLKRQIILDNSTRIFYEHPHVAIQEFMARFEARRAAGETPRPRGVKYDGRLVETFTVTDTGERREMFGYTARHIKTTLTWEATPQSCPQTTLRKESDGWYVDLLYATFCSYDISGFDDTELTAHQQSKCVDYYMGDGKHEYSFERRQVGAARFGFPLLITTKSYGDDGRPLTRTSEVVEITNEELDASLFETPADYIRFKPKKRSLASRALSLFGKG